MGKTLLYAREGVAFDHELVVRDTNGSAVDITGWTFALELQRQAGDVDITLGMATGGAEGFQVADGANGVLRVVIDKSTLDGIGDTTGDFTMFGDLLGTPPGVDEKFVTDVRLNVTAAGAEFPGATTDVILDAVGAVIFLQAQGAAVLAEQWAEEDENVEVEPGKYSAKHHAAKASDALETVNTKIDAVAEAGGFKDSLGDYVWGVVAKDGQCALGILRDGTVDLRLSTTALSALTAQLSGVENSDGAGTTLALSAAETQLSATRGTILSYAANDVAGQNADRVLATINGYSASYLQRQDIASTTWVAEARPASDTPQIMFIPHNGQSLSVGGGAHENASGEEVRIESAQTPQHGLMFNTGARGVGSSVLNDATLTGFDPIYEVFDAGSQGETMGSAMTSWLHRDALRRDFPMRPILYRTHGKGGVSITALDKTGSGNPYQNGIKEMTKAVEIAAKYGMEVYAPFVRWTQGNQDGSDLMPRATYKANLVQLKADYATDFAALLPGGHPSVGMLVDQLSGGSNAPGYPEISLAQWEACEENADIYMVGPYYFQEPTPSGFPHLSPAGYDLMGELGAKVLRRILEGEDWEPLHVESAVRTGDTIVLTLEGGDGSDIVIDTDTVSAQTDYGFIFVDDSSSASIESVAVTGAREITITLDATPTGANKRIRYVYGITRGNIRDTDPTPSYQFPGTYLRNWLICCDEDAS